MVGGPKDGDADAAVDPSMGDRVGLLPFSVEAFGDGFKDIIGIWPG